MLHSSERRFSTGVPVSAKRKGARKRELVVGFKAFHRARRERRGVFDILRLVERAYEQAAVRPIVDIDTKQVI